MRRIVLLLAVTLGLGCDGTAGGPFIISNPGTTSPLQIRLLHASPNAGALELLTAGQSKAGQIVYGDATPYVDISTSSVSLTLRFAGSGVAIIDTIVTLPDSGFLTVVADGDSSAIIIRLLTDEEPGADTTFIKLRMLDESPSLGPLDVYVTAPAVSIDSLTPTIAGISFRAATAYLVLASGTYQVRFTNASTKVVVADAGTFGVGNGDVRTVLVLDADGGGLPAQTRVVSDVGT